MPTMMEAPKTISTSRLGFGLLLNGKLRVCSYSCYGGSHDPAAENVFGMRCAGHHSRKVRIWQSYESAEKNAHIGEVVVGVYPTNDEIRKRCVDALRDDSTLFAVAAQLLGE